MKNYLMKKYGGELIFQESDEHGVIEVVEYKKVIRSMHFGNETQQSGMYLYDSTRLLHPYTQAMLSVTALQEPERVLVLGVGGGSLIKFLLHHFHSAVIDAVDLRQAVINVAHEYFDMPMNNYRLSFHVTDFRNYLIAANNQRRLYDLILIDLFSADEDGNIIIGLDEHIKSIKSLLGDNGMMAINILDGNIDALSCLNELKTLFAGTVYEIPVDGVNTIALATKNVLNDFPSEVEFQYYETKHMLSARKFLDHLCRIG